MPQELLDTKCSVHFTWRQLIHCGETWHRREGSTPNVPEQPESWRGLEVLARTILDPVVDRFGALELTYCFAGAALLRRVPGRVAPALDQHAGSELNARGRLICPRGGQAADLRVAGTSGAEVGRWIAEALPFDRLYFYGADRPLHVSWGPEATRQIVALREGPSGRRVPRVVRSAQDLGEW